MSDSEYTESLEAGQDESEEHHALEQPQVLQFQQKAPNPYMDYAGSTSSSGSSSESSSSMSGDSDGEQDSDDSWEPTKITDDVLNLPRGLCENPAIFREFFSLATWQELPPHIKNHLQQFLPDFSKASLQPQLSAVERARTISMLFNGSLHRFQQSPLNQLQQQLEAGNCRPDIKKLRDNIRKSQRRERKFQHCERLSQMAKQLFLSRQRLLDHAHKSLPDGITKAPPSVSTMVTTSSRRHAKPLNLYRENKLSAIRARKRFFSEISLLTKELGIPDNQVLSADEEEEAERLLDEDLKHDLLSQQRAVSEQKDAGGTKTNVPLAERCVYSTLFRKRSDLEDEIAFRLQQQNQQTRLTNSNFKEFLREHKRRKLTEPTLPEFETSDIRLRDVCGRAQFGGNFKRVLGAGKAQGRKSKVATNAAATSSETSTATTSSSTLAAATLPSVLQTSSNRTERPLTTQGVAAPPLNKLSEPPALVPIQPLMKKPDTLPSKLSLPMTPSTHSTPTTPQNEHHNHNHMQPAQSSMDMTMLQKNSSSTHNSSTETLNISSFMSAHGDNLNLCMDDSSLLAGDHDAFNMLDSEVELQQEEVETFAGSTEDNLTNFVIGNDIVLGSRNSSTPSMLQSSHNSDLHKGNGLQQPLPKLEPITRSHDTKSGSKTHSVSSLSLNASSELIQETHACYFSLIRDFFCSTPNHRMRYDDLKSKIDMWLKNPITALNEWYAMADNWSMLLRSAINFLVGDFPDMSDEFVPYIEHKVQLSIYQWIGAGRDSDTRLMELCNIWMEKRKQPNERTQQQSRHQVMAQNQLLESKVLDTLPKSMVELDENSAENGNVLSPPPPPPRCPTTWTVRAATVEEIAEFQRQERERFEQPHKAYTYRMYGYESVVAPVKGIYTPMLALSKPRGHSMMVEDRPNFVTILTLVRDATARLPNGEGTRADISELLKCSQYINQDAAENVLQTIVSGALDRMHTEHDACVRYDPKRKIWIYLHRNRSEEDFERIHQQNHGAGKGKKLTQQRKPRLPNVGGNSKLSSPEQEMPPMDQANGSLLTMPALVPSNPIVINSNSSVQCRQSSAQQPAHQMAKCPPLKYNIPQTAQPQQQKSLLKSAVRQDLKSAAQALQANKNHNFQIPATKMNANSSPAPIMMATQQDLQVMHVANSSPASSNHGSVSHQLQQKQSSPAQQTTLTANLAGKRVMLNKPIVINQITSNQQQPQSPANNKLKTPQQVVKQPQGRVHTLSPQQQQQMQQLQSNVITIPISMAMGLSGNAGTEQSPTESLKPTQIISAAPTLTANSKQNIIRIVPASNVKTVMSSTGQQQVIQRQRIATTTVAQQQQQQQQQLKSSNNATGIQQVITNSGNIVAVGGATGNIVKMSPQAFASLQQKQAANVQQQQPQQHIIVKQGGNKTPVQKLSGIKAQRVVFGNTGVVTQPAQTKNIVFQQIPVVSSASNASAMSPAQSSPLSGNKIQTISTTSLTPQQQRILIQNLKQQQKTQTINQNQIQFKTVQVVGNNATGNVIARPQTIAVRGAASTSNAKTMVVVSQDNGQPSNIVAAAATSTTPTRILKTSAPIKIDSAGASPATRVISSSGQIISLDSLIQKQGGTLRIAGNTAAKVNANQTMNATVLQSSQPGKQLQQQPQQFAIVSVPNSIISLGASNNLAVGQRVITTQAASSNVSTTLVNADGTRATTAIMSTGQRRILTTPKGTKIISSQAAGVSPGSGGGIRVLNAVNQVGGINLATLQGKQVVLASGKTVTAINKVQLQNQQPAAGQTNVSGNGSIVIGGQSLKLQPGSTNLQQLLGKSGNIITSQAGGASSSQSNTNGQLQTVIMGNQILRVQQMPQIVTAAGNRLATTTVAANKLGNDNDNANVVTPNAGKTIFVGAGGQTLRLQPASSVTQTVNKNVIVNSNQKNITTFKTTANNAPGNATNNRVVLAMPGGGQIFLSPNYQNLKSLSNLKMVSLAQNKNQAGTSTAAPAATNILHNTSSSSMEATHDGAGL